MRLKQRMNVLLPHPDGPMNAVTKFFWMSRVDALERDVARIQHRSSVTVNTVSAPRPSGEAASSPSLPESIRGVVTVMNPRECLRPHDLAWGSER